MRWINEVVGINAARLMK